MFYTVCDASSIRIFQIQTGIRCYVYHVLAIQIDFSKLGNTIIN